MKILKTTDYGLFKIAKFNRSINKGNVERLVELNKTENNFNLFPIVVDKDFTVIDGQHRLEACKKLKAPVYYIFCKNKEASPDFVFKLNQAGRKHTLEDKIFILAKSGNTQAKTVLSISKNSKMKSISILECLYSALGNKAKDLLVSNKPFNSNGINIVRAIENLPFEKISNRFARGFTKVVNNFNVQPDFLTERLMTNWHLVFDAGREIDVYRNIVSTYSKGLRFKNRLEIVLK